MTALLVVLSASAREPGALPVEVVAIPARPRGADDGTTFADRVAELAPGERFAVTAAELLRGNVPEPDRTFWPVVLQGPGGAGPREVVVWVSGGYVAIGTELDRLEVPLDLPSAATVALAWDCGLPTPKLVDAIYDQAAVRTAPVPLPPGPQMESIAWLLDHRALWLAQLGDALSAGPALMAGQKKDLVLTQRLAARPRHEAIYGWHRGPGAPIQPLSLWHLATYADYSHGVRLVFGEVSVDGTPMSLWDALADPVIGAILSDEGPIPDARGLLREAIEGSR